MPSRIKSIHCLQLLVLFSQLPLLSSFAFSSFPSHSSFRPSLLSSAASITSYRHDQNIASLLPYHHSALSLSSSTNINAPPPSETEQNDVKHKPHQNNNSQRKRKNKNNNNNNTVKWIACSSTTEVNRAISHYICPGDNVAELGSQLRTVSTTLCETIGPYGTAMLVDVQRKFPKYESTKGEEGRRTSAMRLQGDDVGFYEDRARFVEMREFEFWRDALFFAPNSKNSTNMKKNEKPAYDALVVDMSTVAGNDLELTCISLVKEFIALNHRGSSDTNNDDNNNGNNDGNNEQQQQQCCRTVIIKSGSLHNLARRLYHAQHVLSGARQLPDNHGKYNGGRASIIGAVGVKQYRDTIPFVVHKGDVCVEVGCHLGTTTTIIDKAAKKKPEATEEEKNGVDENGNDESNAVSAAAADPTAPSKMGLLSGGGGGGCLGVDVGSSIIASAKKKYPHLSFEVGDGFKTGALARMRYKHFGTSIDHDDNNNNGNAHHGSSNGDSSTTGGGGAVTNRDPTYDVVYVDIGGLSGSEGLLEAVSLLTSLDNALEPRCIVIKSLCVRRLASCLIPFSEIWRKELLLAKENET